MFPFQEQSVRELTATFWLSAWGGRGEQCFRDQGQVVNIIMMFDVWQIDASVPTRHGFSMKISKLFRDIAVITVTYCTGHTEGTKFVHGTDSVMSINRSAYA